jgi:hypothetical protein
MKAKPAKTWHWADVDKSDRLKRVILLLQYRTTYMFEKLGWNKFSAREISWYACVNSGQAVIAELRKNGIDIKSENRRGRWGTHKLYWIEK